MILKIVRNRNIDTEKLFTFTLYYFYNSIVVSGSSSTNKKFLEASLRPPVLEAGHIDKNESFPKS